VPKYKAPLLPLFAAPVLSEISPLPPDSDEPDPIRIDPLSPALAVPVLNTIMPLTPDVPALFVIRASEPLDVAEP
jgi:hypothetical protein